MARGIRQSRMRRYGIGDDAPLGDELMPEGADDDIDEVKKQVDINNLRGNERINALKEAMDVTAEEAAQADRIAQGLEQDANALQNQPQGLNPQPEPIDQLPDVPIEIPFEEINDLDIPSFEGIEQFDEEQNISRIVERLSSLELLVDTMAAVAEEQISSKADVGDDPHASTIRFESEDWVQEDDVLVAVDEDAEAGYLGAAYDDGVLRTDGGASASSDPGLHYADGGDYVTISHADTSTQSNVSASSGEAVTALEFDDAGHVTSATVAAVSGSVPSGTDDGDMLIWSSGAWAILSIPAGPAVLVYDATSGVRWQVVDAAYKTVYRNASNQMVDDYLRAY